MLFNSIHFAIFLPIVLLLYWFQFQEKLKTQNCFLLVCSYFFYACWNYKFLFLLFFSTYLDFFTGHKMQNASSKKHKRFWFWLSVTVNLGFLGLFKYYNFFISSFSDLVAHFGITVHPQTLQVILPVGISFYTFHGLSYVIDIYKDRIKAEKSFIDYAVFVSFFPLLVAGPIERATHLLPQIKKKREFNYARQVDGLRQILWGLFKKIVIADSCAEYANTIFNDPTQYSGSTHIMGALFFSFQIYCDFSGYSDIALGTARLMGIELLRNFAFPYFSRDIAEFWRRWHISLSSWFRDYVYIPLGGSKVSTWKKVKNTFIIFLLSGFWHGANWTFIIWGALNAVYFLPLLLLKKNRDNLEIVAKGRFLPSIHEVFQMGTTFALTTFAWIFFRAQDFNHAIGYISTILSSSTFTIPSILPFSLMSLLLVFILIEWTGRDQPYAIAEFGLNWPRPLRLALYCSIVLVIYLSTGKDQAFIYFQF